MILLTRERKDHIAYYGFLIMMLLGGCILVFAASGYKQMQMTIVVLITLFYIIMGVVHHAINHDLSAKIVIEYILIGSFGIASVFFLLKGSLF